MSIKKNFFAPLSKGLGATRRAAMFLLVMMLTTVTTWADNYVTLTSTTKTWNNNTYVTNGDVTIADRITVKGNVTLILTDGYTLSAPNGIEVKVGNSLTIEGGTNGTGTLIIAKNEYSKAGIGGGSGTHSWDPIKYGNITINGGIVNVKGGAQSAGIGGGCNSELTGNGTITINGGIVNATGGNKAAGIGGGNCSLNSGAKGGCGKIVINGGQVTATGGENAPGIGPGNGAADKTSGSLVLGWAKTLDFIQVTGGNSSGAYGFSNRLGSISFADGKKFNIVGVGEATTENIKNKVSLTLVPKGSEQNQLSAANISGISASYDLTGSSLDIPFSVIDAEGNTLTLGTDYTATLGTIALNSASIHITEGGKYTLTITGKGSYAGSKSVDFEVVSIGFKKDANGGDYINMPKTGIEKATIPSGVSSFKVYDDGGAKAKYSNSYDGGLVLTAPDHYVLQLTGTVTAEVWGKDLRDYLMVYDGGSTSAQKIGDKYGSDESGEDIGTLISSGKQMTLTFHSDNSGQRDGLDLKVTLKRDLGSCVIADIDDQTYTGSAIEPDVTVTDGETTLTLGTDYEVAYYSNNISAGTATVTITGKGNYAKTTSKTFTIVKATPTVTAPAAVENLIYTGGSLNLVAAGTTDFGTLLYSTDGNNYSEDIPTATNAGTYTVYYKVAGDANHNDVSGSIEVTITQKAVTNDGITITIPSQVWTGSELTPVITVKDGETELIKNTDYTVTAPSGTIQDAGDYTYTISGKGNYSGEKAATFTIIPKAVTNDGITIAAIADKTYTGSAIEPEVTVTDGETTLALGTDYTIGYSANVNVGTATATITGKGNYSGEKAATFTIIPKAVTNDGITIAAIADQTYTGSAIVPEVTVTDGETTLTLETDYTIGYSANVNVGTATATITGMGNYTGSREVLFTIAKATTAVTTLTAVENLIYNGSAQALVNAGSTNFGTLLYSLDGQNYSDDIPTGTDAGTYTVYYKVEGSDNWNAVAAQTIEVTITYFDASLAAIVDNSDVISNIITNYDSKANVTLSDRTLYKDGNWNTLCLPFDVSDFTGTPLEGATVKKLDTETEYSGHKTGLDGTTLYLYFKDATKIDAGKPYIIKWASGDNLVNPVFTGVTVSNAKNDVAFTGGSFKGNYDPLEITAATNRNNIVVLAAGNKLGYTTTDRTIANGKALGAFRAYFYIPEKDGTTGASSFVLNFGDEETTTGIVDNKRETITNNHWYSLDGRKLDGKPTQKGLYIVNGKKVVIK